MSASTASVRTESASRYLQQLCKHWGHRFAVSFTPEKGDIDFGEMGRLALAAAGPSLDLRLESPDAEGRVKMERVVEEHLKRFAFREELSFDWRPEAA